MGRNLLGDRSDGRFIDRKVEFKAARKKRNASEFAERFGKSIKHRQDLIAENGWVTVLLLAYIWSQDLMFEFCPNLESDT